MLLVWPLYLFYSYKNCTMKILKLSSTDPRHNLATEEYLLCNYTDDEIILLWQSENAVVVGLHQNTLEEINRKFVNEKQIDVVRRRSGGGAVYHDLGNLNFAFISRADSAAQVTMERFTHPVVEVLRSLDLPAEASGRNDILINGKKVSGNAQALHRQRILHHGTLLFNSDLSVLSKALKVQAEKFQSKSIKSVRSSVANIASFLQQEMSMEAFSDYVLSALSNKKLDGGLPEKLELKDADYAAIDQLYAEKYNTWEWNFGRSPAFSFKNSRLLPSGELYVEVLIKSGYISECALKGSATTPSHNAVISDKLQGCRYEPEDVLKRLASLSTVDVPVLAELDLILDCFFNTSD